MKTILLEQKHSKLIYKFVTVHGRSFPELLNPSFREFSQNRSMIATIDREIINQIAFSDFKENYATTRLFGQFSDETINILNCLCAISASHSPEIIYHSFYILSNKYNFMQAYALSRLGQFSTKIIEDNDKTDKKSSKKTK
jgi:hypothetical protein